MPPERIMLVPRSAKERLRIAYATAILRVNPYSHHKHVGYTMNRRRKKEILMAVGILVGFVVVMAIISWLA